MTTFEPDMSICHDGELIDNVEDLLNEDQDYQSWISKKIEEDKEFIISKELEK